MATNGPRTGKYDENSNIVNEHKNSTLDKVSTKFIESVPNLTKFYNF